MSIHQIDYELYLGFIEGGMETILYIGNESEPTLATETTFEELLEQYIKYYTVYGTVEVDITGLKKLKLSLAALCEKIDSIILENTNEM